MQFSTISSDLFFTMGRKRDLNEYQKGSINALFNEGFNQAYVAAKLKISKFTVSRFVNGKRSSKKNSGRKKMSSTRQDRIPKRLCLTNILLLSLLESGKTQLEYLRDREPFSSACIPSA